eukprot:8229830-Pyramimonas_sp.AAC.1
MTLLSKVTLASFPFCSSSAALAGRALPAKCRYGLARPSHPSRASFLYGLAVPSPDFILAPA